MANDAFLRKLAQDDLWDTMYFASGEVPAREKTEHFIVLKTSKFTTRIYTNRNIVVNDTKCKTIYLAKLFIQQNLS